MVRLSETRLEREGQTSGKQVRRLRGSEWHDHNKMPPHTDNENLPVISDSNNQGDQNFPHGENDQQDPPPLGDNGQGDQPPPNPFALRQSARTCQPCDTPVIVTCRN